MNKELWQKKEQFCRLFDSVSKTSGGIVYNQLLRLMDDDVKVSYHNLYNYLLQKDKNKEALVLKSIDRQHFIDTHTFAKYYITLSAESKEVYKNLTKRAMWDAKNSD